MNKTRILLASLVIGSIALYSCGDDSNPANGNNRVNSMPNAVGMLWVYEVFDSLTQTADTATVSITHTINGGVIGVRWKTRRSGSNPVSERIAVVTGDTLDFIIDTTFIAPPLERFVFPLSLGSQWSTSSGLDSSFVTDINTVSNRAGTFRSSAQVERTELVGFEGARDSSVTWIAPNVGIVSRYFHSISTDGGGNFFVTMNQTWELIDYDLSTFSINQFPGAIGSEWTYEIVDSRFNNPDTVIVSIADYPQIPGFDSTKIWLINGTIITDTQFVAYVNNQVWVSEDTLMSFLWDWRYSFPLALGRGWSLPGAILGLPRIKAKVAITTPAGEFPSAFHYSMLNGGFNVIWVVDDWLVPGVGVVKRTYQINDFGLLHTQEWTLLSYRLR